MRVDLAAHVKWFTDPVAHPTDWSLLATAPVLIAFAIAIAAVGLAYAIQRRVPEPKIVSILDRFARTAPLVLGLHIGIALIASALLGVLFSPNLRPDDELLGRAILVVEAMCGLILLLGLATRAGAVLLALLGLIAMMPLASRASSRTSTSLGSRSSCSSSDGGRSPLIAFVACARRRAARTHRHGPSRCSASRWASASRSHRSRRSCSTPGWPKRSSIRSRS